MNYTYYKNYITDIVSVIEDNKEIAYLDYQADLFKGSNNNLVKVDDKYYLTSMSQEDFYSWFKHPATEDKFELLEVTDISDNMDDQGDQYISELIQSGQYDGAADTTLVPAKEAFYIGTVGCKEQLHQEIISILFTYSSWAEQDIMDIIFEEDVAMLKDGDSAEEIYGEMSDYIDDSNEVDISIKEAADEICGINLLLDFEIEDKGYNEAVDHNNRSDMRSNSYNIPKDTKFWVSGVEHVVKNVKNENGTYVIYTDKGDMFNAETLRANGTQFQEPPLDEKVKKIKAITKAEYKELISDAMSGLEYDIAADVQVDLSSQMIENPAIVKRVLIDNPDIQPEDVQDRIMWDMEMAI